ncbi:het-d [Cordyceps javanica]|nr:het-d [Cordyceps javanica]
MAPRTVELDPQGDLIIEIPELNKATREASDEQIEQDDVHAIEVSCPTPGLLAFQLPPRHFAHEYYLASDTAERQIVHFRVSTKHLQLASDRARCMFLHPFAESNKDEVTGLFKWTFEALFDVEAFRIVLSVIHGQSKIVPERVSVRLLAEISAVVEDLQCRDAVWFYAKVWLRYLGEELPAEVSPDLFDWIFISSVFDEPSIFTATTQTAIRTSIDAMGDYLPPIAPRIIGTPTIQQRRRDLIYDLLTTLDKKVVELRLGLRSDCAVECKDMLLGALIRHMTSIGVFYAPESRPMEWSRKSVQSILQEIRGFNSPLIFVPGWDTGETGIWDLRQESDDIYAHKQSYRHRKSKHRSS